MGVVPLLAHGYVLNSVNSFIFRIANCTQAKFGEDCANGCGKVLRSRGLSARTVEQSRSLFVGTDFAVSSQNVFDEQSDVTLFLVPLFTYILRLKRAYR